MGKLRPNYDLEWIEELKKRLLLADTPPVKDQKTSAITTEKEAAVPFEGF
jgi:hypothetical protein